MSNELMVLQTDCAEVLEPEIVSEDKVFVAGRNWSSMNIRRGFVIEGRTIKEILCDALRREFDKTPTEFQEKLWLDRCRCKVNGVEIEAERWSSYVPKAGEFVEFLVAPKGGGGGGGKNVLNSILMVAVIVAAVVTQQYYLATYGTLTTAGGLTGAAAVEAASIGMAVSYTGGSLAMAGLAASAVMTVGTYAVNKLCPVTASPQQAQSSTASDSSPTYSLNGSSNSANPYGYVPLVLGRFRYSGPLGAKSWTKQIGDDQYFNMLVVWGHEHMTVRDLRIGETPLSEFKDVTHVFHNSTTGNDLKYFNKSYNEQSVGAALAHNSPVVREIGECDSISVDIYFPALADVTSGNTASASVTFRIEYALSGTENWQAYAQSSRFFAPAQYRSSYPCGGFTNLYCSSDGMWHASPCGDKGDNRPGTMIRVDDPHWHPFPIERYKDKHKKHEYWTRDTWYDAGVQPYVTISAGSTRPITRTFEWAVPHGKYKVRITRITEDKNMETVYDEATWSIARAIVNQPAFNTPVPICCSEIRIRANEQLSGYVSDLNALCTSFLPIYDKYDADGELIKDKLGWVKEETTSEEIGENFEITEITTVEEVYGETVNPADHIRYLLTSRHALNAPYSEAKIDEASLANFAEHCIDSDYQFSLVCDSEAAAWNRLTSVAAAGRGAITTDNDGLFGVTVDNDKKSMTQMFTPRNSWGFSIERAFYSIPHALRVSYYDEDDDYKQKEGFVYADGYNKNNATDIVEWSMTGKTRWEDNYRMGRYYLASLKLRPVTVTLSTDWEWMMCRRGDVVGVSHDVLLNTFGTARIIALIYKTEEGDIYYVHREEDVPSTDDALPIGVKLDDTVIFSEEYPIYGIAIRSKSGTVLTYSLQSEAGEESSDMVFSNPITAAQMPYLGALASVSVLGSETAKYLVAAINVSDHNSAELTLVPWAMPEIVNSENSEIADWEPPLYLPSISAKGALPAPKIREIKSDETMLRKSGNSLVAGLGVWWDLPSGIDPIHGRVFIQGKITLGNTDEVVSTGMVDPLAVNFIEFTDVKEGQEYGVSLRLVSDKTGKTSDWSNTVTHKVIGRTTPPPAPTNIRLATNPPAGVNVSWDCDDVADFAYFNVQLMCGEFVWEGKVADKFVNIPVREQTGEVVVKVSTVDVLKLESPQTVFPAIGGDAFIIEAPLQPGNVATSVESDVFIIAWTDCETTWPLDYYEVLEVDKNGAELSRNYTNSTKFEISPRKALENYYFRIKAVDIFGNAGTVASPSVSIPALSAPILSLGVEGGNIVASWTHTRSAFAIDRYVLQDAATNTEFVNVKGNETRFLIPEVTLEQEGKEIYETLPLETEKVYSYEVKAVDIVGNESPTDEASIVIQNPLPPTNIIAEVEGDHIRLSWTPPDVSKKAGNFAPVKTYDVLRKCEIEREDGIKETVTQYYGRSDITSLIVPAVSTGRHTFLVRTVDSTNNVSSWGSQDFTVVAPGKVTFFNSSATDNNVMLYYTDPSSVFFPIREYLIEEIDTVSDKEVSMVVGRTDTHFFAEVRTEAEDVVYGVTPIDIAGNMGERAKIKISVKQPPDFVLYVDTYSTFNGERTYMDLDGKGHMYGPVPPDESWSENLERVESVIGKDSSVITWEDKTSNGLTSYLSPALNTEGKYVETIDVGDEIPSSIINITVTSTILDGNPAETCKIEVSRDGKSWRTALENGYKVFESTFKYIRLTLVWTGGLVMVSDINVRLEVKKKTDFGRVIVEANDNGEGWVSETATPMLTGKWVAFGTNFIDVQSFPKPNVTSDLSGDLTAFVVFEDVLNPRGFRVFVKDKAGARQRATVDWSAFGV